VKSEELSRLVRLSYDHVGKNGRDSARIYCAVVELDGQVLMWRKRAYDLGWQDLPTGGPVDDLPPAE
jgi:hypothetical protein